MASSNHTPIQDYPFAPSNLKDLPIDCNLHTLLEWHLGRVIKSRSDKDLVRYYHQCCTRKSKSTPRIEDTFMNAVLNRIDVVRLILHHFGADVLSHHQYNNQTPLYAATMVGNLEIVKVLIEAGANIDAMDKDGYSPFHIAILMSDDGSREQMFIDVMDYLLAAGSQMLLQPDGEGKLPLFKAMEIQKIAVYRCLVKWIQKLPVDEQIATWMGSYGPSNSKIMHWLAFNEWHDEIERIFSLNSISEEKVYVDCLRKQICAINEIHVSTLHLAVCSGNSQTIEAVMKYGSLAKPSSLHLLDLPMKTGPFPLECVPEHVGITKEIESVCTLRALGATKKNDSPLIGMDHPLSEDTIAKTRERVYFGFSLTYWLLLILEQR